MGCWLAAGAWAQVQSPEDIMAMEADTASRPIIKPDYIHLTNDQLSDIFDRMPSFGMFHDNYFLTGVPLDRPVNKYTADAKFQISIRQRLTKTILPWNTFLMLTYTQKSFWHVYQKSSPFGDSNYNPGLLIGKPLIADGRFKGMATFAFEHESNGRDSITSRSWNYFVLSGCYYFNFRVSMQLKLWAGWPGSDNPNLLDYKGYGLAAINYHDRRERIWASVVLNPCSKGCNTQMELSYNPFSSKANVYLFAQWYQGYAEKLLGYDHYTSMLRFGICFKPPLWNFY